MLDQKKGQEISLKDVLGAERNPRKAKLGRRIKRKGAK